MARKKTKKKTVQVDSLKHKDKRPNIPTEEMRDFVREEEDHPKTVLYPRDPSLDPQLVWQGKDEQDAHPLEVPAVPVYIQEKIHPQAIVEDVNAEAVRRAGEKSARRKGNGVAEGGSGPKAGHAAAGREVLKAVANPTQVLAPVRSGAFLSWFGNNPLGAFLL
ncbi:MAG: hypothetical protein V1918_10065 [Planctomycetota bacterium]